MPKPRILHAIPSPRDNIQEVLDYQPDLPWDKFIPKFLPEMDAYYLARNYFLKHPEYTHFAVGTDDIVIKPEHCLRLEKDLREFDYPVLTGMMNVFQEDHDLLNITPIESVPSPDWATRTYNWINVNELYRYTVNGKNPIIQVGFSGFPLMIIRRDVLSKIPFDSDSSYNPIPYSLGGSLDVQFCYSCYRSKIPIFCDTRVNMEHLRASGTIRVGTAKPHVMVSKDNYYKRFEVDYKKKEIKYENDFDLSGVLYCTVCRGESTGDNFKEACDKLDHGVGLVIKRPCPAHPSTLIWNGRKINPKQPETVNLPYLFRA